MGVSFRSAGHSWLTVWALSTPVCGAAQAVGSEVVRITGRVLVPDGYHAPVDLTVVDGDSSCVWVPVRGSGKFRLDARADQCYVLRFDQAGCLSKAVRVDTRFVAKKAGTSRRAVDFDVVLVPEADTGDLHYTGPVGRIKFHRSNGRQQVTRNYTMQKQGLVVMDDMPACDPQPEDR